MASSLRGKRRARLVYAGEWTVLELGERKGSFVLHIQLPTVGSFHSDLVEECGSDKLFKRFVSLVSIYPVHDWMALCELRFTRC